MAPTPHIEIIIVRDPDGPTHVHPYVDGVELAEGQYTEYVIDAGAGHSVENWVQMRDEAIAEASPAVAERLRIEFNDPPGAGEIQGGWPPGTD